MFENFIEKLCAKEGLVDIANQGIAKQSSHYERANYNHPQKAVNGENVADFAFHTNKELHPWWSLEWKQPVNLNYIIINNRRNEHFWNRASNIQILAITDNGGVVTLHQGHILFGCLPESMPLILPIPHHISIKKLKIILPIDEYLHLHSVHCLTQASMQEQYGRLLFFANRTDGFGERMRAILNAISLSEKNNGDFFFGWKGTISTDFQAIDAVNKTFSYEFIKAHYLEEKDITSLNLINIEKLNPESINFEDLKSYDGILVQQAKHSLQSVFPKIGFSELLFNAKIAAEKINLSNKKMVAIHLRMGDIVYGRWHYSNIFYYKVIPVYILDGLIRKLQNQGFEVIIFGQDDDFCNDLVRRYGVIYAGNMVPNDFNETQKALFEIVLMSRCKKIIARTSGFSTLSSLIGGIQKIDDYTDYLDSKEINLEFKKSIRSGQLLNSPCTHPTLRAFSISYFLNYNIKNLEINERTKLIEQCVISEPTNSYYLMLQSACYYDVGRVDEANEILYQELCQVDKKYGIYYLLSDFAWRKTVTITQYLESFRRASNAGSVVASLIMLLHQKNVDKYIDYTYFKNILLSSPNDSLGIDLLRNNLKDIII